MNASVPQPRSRRSLTILAVLIGLAAGLIVSAASPAVAAIVVPVLRITGAAACSSQLDGEIAVGWTLEQNTNFGGPFVSTEESPKTGLNPNSTGLYGKGPVEFTQRIPGGNPATTASLTVAVNFGLPGGDQVITGTATITLPHCPHRVAPTVSVALSGTTPQTGCLPLATITITYPASAELTTAVTVKATAADSSTWSVAVSLRPGDARTVHVPPPYGVSILVEQDDTVVLGSFQYPNRPSNCASYGADPGGDAGAPPPPTGSSGHATGPGQTPIGGSPATPVVTPPPITDAPSADPTSAPPAGGDPGAAANVRAPATRLVSVSTTAVAGPAILAGMLVVIAGPLLWYRRRRRPTVDASPGEPGDEPVDEPVEGPASL